MSQAETVRTEARRSGKRERMSLGSRLTDYLSAILGIALIVAVATVPMAAREQALFATGTAIVFLIVNRLPGRGVTMFLIALSLAVSLRYIFWRITETLDFASPVELLLGTGLALAEVYAIIVLVLGYVQCIWPLSRKPMPLPDDPDTWPTVDVYVPTYNEPMTIVRATVLAAMAIDWPRDKMRVFILDDGRREEFRQFAEACGCGYITRKSNAHAKAGNLNHAMTVTDGEFICVFDCDHIPTRAFLQMTVGWLVAEKNLAMVQTPHHFYSPDPFQRNLAAGTRVPAEGNMFYGLIQDGNDYWNACFFCGSCAVIRRTALEEINGFAVETVTEDAHTMLKLHRRGWDSAYLRLPLAAGLATERLMLHIGQRIRWARGMIQILRIDNPLFGPGLSFGQRICYLQAMGHFLFAIPRLVFLTSPLAYLLLGQNIIAASPLAITAYALPHIFHSVATNSRVQQQWRHSFWSEIYETVLALFLVRVTLVTLASPRRGKFNVTAKGGLLENGFFDLSAVYPNLILAFLLIAGVVRGVLSLFLVYGERSATQAQILASQVAAQTNPAAQQAFETASSLFQTQTLTLQALLLNSIWASFSMLTVLAALSVGRETRQIRSRARILTTVPITVVLPDGRGIAGQTRDLSQGGGSLTVDRPEGFSDNSALEIEFDAGEGPILVPARSVRWEGSALQVRWEPQTIEEEARVVQAVFGRADTWTDWANYPKDRPLASLYRVLVSIRGLFRPPDRAPRRVPGQGGTGGDQAVPGSPAPAAAESGGGRALAGSIAAGIVFLLLCALPAQAQQRAPGTTIRPLPQSPLSAPGVPAIPVPSSGLAVRALPAGLGGTDQQAPPPPLPSAAGVPSAPQAPLLNGLTDTNRPGTRQVVYNLTQLGAQGPLSLTGTSEWGGVKFGVRADEVVTAGQLSLIGATSPSLIPEVSNVTVTLNEQYVGTIPVNREQPNYQLEMPVSPVFFQDNNLLNFHFAGRITMECNDPLNPLIWAKVYDRSTLTLTLERLPPQRDLARLPMPFFDSHEKQLLSLPVILPANPSNDVLRASAITASWFGQLASFRGASFPVTNEPPAQGNAVMVLLAADARGLNYLPPINGATLAVIANPNDSLSSILVIAGRTGDEVAAAATALTLGSRALGNDVAVVQAPEVAPRRPYDAPAWIPTDRPVKLGELVDATELQSYGYEGSIHIPFRTAPDFYTWRDRPFPVDLRYRGPPGPIIDVSVSRLDSFINGNFLGTFSLGDSEHRDSWLSRLIGLGSSSSEARVDVPSYYVYGLNDLQFYFDAKPLRRGDCAAVPSDLRMSVDPDSTIDLSRGYRFSTMPNIAYFVSSGFPFTRMADLSETAVILPDRPTTVEIGAFLNLMGRIGGLTGFPVVRIAVARPSEAASVADRDILIIGALPRLQSAGNLFRTAPLRVDGNRLAVAQTSALESVRRIFGDRTDVDREVVATTLSAGLTEGTAVLMGGESPLKSGRSMVAIVASAPQGLDAVLTTLRATNPQTVEKVKKIQGDLAFFTGGDVTSYRVGPTYTVGVLPFWLWPSWYLRDQPLGVAALMLVGCVLCGVALYWAVRRKASGRLSQSTLH